MAELEQLIGWVNLAAFGILGVAALIQWRRRKDRAAMWAAAAFAALGLVVVAGEAIPDDESMLAEILGRVLIVVLVTFPYLLFRFAAAFERPPRRLELTAAGLTAGILLWTTLLPDIPQEGEPRPAWFTAYIVALLVEWTFLSALVTWRLWRAGRGQPTVARRRMQLLGAAAAALTIALFVAAAAPEPHSALAVAVSLLVLASAILFLLGLSPPSIVRLSWRRTEQEKLQRAVTGLVGASGENDVLERVLPPMTQIVGASGVALIDSDGEVIGAHGEDVDPNAVERGIVRLDLPSGARLVVRTSPYAPFFGNEELGLLSTLGALTELALDRARLFSQEQRARRELEAADELKTNFVALAAHELRTPVTSVHGIVETITRIGSGLDPDDRAELEGALREQSVRLRVLVDQLLDLSRLDAQALPLVPERIPVLREVEQLLAAAAGDRAREVEVEVPADLEAIVDRIAFDRVVSNLLVNALRYGEPPFVVRAERLDRHFRLSVEDCGPGVPPEFVPSLFERFARSDEARSRGQGTGLGLAIARSYALAHGGDLLYRPSRVGGAHFELVLPAEP